jgi:hypothetical protein
MLEAEIFRPLRNPIFSKNRISLPPLKWSGNFRHPVLNGWLSDTSALRVSLEIDEVRGMHLRFASLQY